MLMGDARGLLGQLFVVGGLGGPEIGLGRFQVLPPLQGHFRAQYQCIGIGRQILGGGLRACWPGWYKLPARQRPLAPRVAGTSGMDEEVGSLSDDYISWF